MVTIKKPKIIGINRVNRELGLVCTAIARKKLPTRWRNVCAFVGKLERVINVTQNASNKE